MLVTVDTNVFVYAFDNRDPVKQATANWLIPHLLDLGALVGVQVLGELFCVLSSKLKMPRALAVGYVDNIGRTWPVFASDRASTLRALSLAASGRFSFWDANLVSAAESVGCTYFLTEDMADGARIGDLELVNPFGPDGPTPRVREILSL